MKVLIQNTTYYPRVIGGAEMSSYLLAVKLFERGHQADAMASTGRRRGPARLAERPLPETPGTVYEAPSHGFADIYDDNTGGLAAQPGLVMRGLHHFANVHSRRWRRWAGEALDRSRPDILHTNTIVGMTAAVWEAARERGIPIVHTLRDYHLLCPRTTLLRSSGQDCVDAPLPCRVLRSLKLRQTGGIGVVTAPSTFVLRTHTEAGGFPGARAVRVPNACETIPDDVPDRSRLAEPRGIFLGQLDHHKGVGLILSALAGLLADPATPPFGFDFAGVGPMQSDVEAFCRRDPERFRYHGMVKGEDKARLLRQAAFLLVPSVWNDNFPRTMLDAFGHGLPVIGSNRGGIPEVVGNEQEGIIIEPDAGRLQQAIARYLAAPALRLAHGEAARRAAQLYTLDRQVDAFVEIYESLRSG